MGIGAQTITRPFERLLALLVALAVFASLLLVFAPTAEAISNPHEPAHWEDLYPNAKRCYKFGSPVQEVHGTATDEGVVLNEFEWNGKDWPGDHWEVLIIKAGSDSDGGDDDFGHKIYEHPDAGVLYTALDGKDVSHWIVCKGEDPETEPGNIVVVKEVKDGSSTDKSFDFTASYDGDGFSLSDGQSNDSGDLAVGSYSVSEEALSGWTLVSAACESNATDAEINPGAITLSEGETVTCTFVNEEDTPPPTTPPPTTPPPTTPPPEPGIIIVKKEVTEGLSTDQSFVFTASYDADGFSLKHGDLNQSGDLAAGTYSVSETPLDGWILQSAACDDGSNPIAISLQEGETVTCTFVNDVPTDVSPTSIVNTTDPEVSPETLPFTGADSGTPAALALMLIAGGVLALIGTRGFREETDE